MIEQFSEAIKLKDGKFYNLEFHQKRINITSSFYSKNSFDLRILLQNIENIPNIGLYKCRIVYGLTEPKVEFIQYELKHPKTVKIVFDDTINYSYKSTNRLSLNNLLSNSNCDDIVIVKNGYITDGFASNLIFERKGKLFTPISYLLKGTKRESLLNTKKIVEKEITLHNIKEFQKMYFINAMIDIEDDISIRISKLI